jgi:predicted nucleic acid-binding protein
VAVVLDSATIVGFLDREDALHGAADAAIRDLIGKQRLLISVVTFSEVVTGAQLGHQDEQTVREFFDELISDVLPVDLTVAMKASELRSRLKSLRMPDALILAGAETDPEVGEILTGDSQMPKVPGVDCRVRLLR